MCADRHGGDIMSVHVQVVDVLNRGGAVPADLEDDDFPLAFAGRHSVMLQEVVFSSFVQNCRRSNDCRREQELTVYFGESRCPARLSSWTTRL